MSDQITPLVQRQVKEKEEEELLQTKELIGHTPEMTPRLASAIASMQGGGQPLPPSERTFFEPRFGQDFSHVRIHTGLKAAESAQAVNARAFTVGRDIVFGAGEYAPETRKGQRLLAHELTHVVQQYSYQMKRTHSQAQEVSAMAGRPEQISEMPVATLARQDVLETDTVAEQTVDYNITPGEFGRALGLRLEMYVRPENANGIIERLKASPTFMAIARELDERVVGALGGNLDLALWPGPDVVRRAVIDFILSDGTASYFEPRKPLDDVVRGGLIVIGFGTETNSDAPFESAQIDRIADVIIHETAHLKNYLDQRKTATTAQEAVTLGVQEERRVRTVEARAREEIEGTFSRSTPPASLQQQISDLEASRNTRDIERSLTQIGRRQGTYLEQFALGFLIEESAKNLSRDELDSAKGLHRDIERELGPAMTRAQPEEWGYYSVAVEISALVSSDAQVRALASNRDALDYVTGEVVFDVINARWSSFRKEQPASLTAYAAAKEELLQGNLQMFGSKAGVSYQQ